MNAGCVFEFDQYRLDISQRLLYRNGERLHLTPKLFDTLALLVERQGQIVSKEELAATLWPNTVVEPGGLPRNISMLRRALGDDGERFIETIPKRGYRFIAQARLAPQPIPESPRVPPKISEIREVGEITVLGSRGAAGTRTRGWRTPATTGLAIGLATALVAWWLARSSPPAYTASAITSNADILPVTSAAVSADGRYIAYAEMGEIILRHMESRQTHRLPSPANTWPTFLDWHPSGDRVLVSGPDMDTGVPSVWSLSIRGGTPILLISNATSAAVCPTGEQIAFVRDSTVWIASADGSNARKLREAGEHALFPTRPQFSSDGRYLLLGRAFINAPRTMIEAQRLSDGTVRTLFDSDGYTTDFRLMPDDKELVVAKFAAEYSSSTRLLSIEVDLDRGALGAPRTIAQWPEYSTHNMTVTRDGSRLVFVRDRTQPDVYVAGWNAEDRSLANPRRLTLDQSRDRPADWLDERTVLFHSNRAGTFDIYAQEIDSQHARALIDDTEDEIWPIVSVSRGVMFYMSTKSDGFSPGAPITLMRKPLAGGPSTALETSNDPFRAIKCAAQSPRCMLGEHEDGELVLTHFDADSGRGRQFLRIPWNNVPYFGWALSPDGARVATVEGTDWRSIRIYSVDEPDAEPREISVPDYDGFAAISWDATGTGFFASSSRGDVGLILHVDLEGHTRIVRRQMTPRTSWAIPSPDGKHLAFMEWTAAGNVWMLERE